MAKKTKKKAAKPKLTKAKGFLPGMAPLRNAALDKKCQEYLDAQTDTGAARLKEKDKHAKVIELMKAQKIAHYIHEPSGQRFSIDITEKIKHRNHKDDPSGVNPDGPGDDDLDEKDGGTEEVEPTGQSEVLDGVSELADEAK